MTLPETWAIRGTTPDADHLEHLAVSIGRLTVLDLASAAGPGTWSMPAADQCRRRLLRHRDRILALHADVQRRAALLRAGDGQSHRNVPQ